MSPLLWCCSCSSFIFLLPLSQTRSPLILWDSALTWHRWTSCLAAPHYSLSNDLNADRADVCLYSMPLRWPPVQRRSGRAPGRKRKLILASRNDLLCSRFGLAGRQHAISRSSALSLPGLSVPPPLSQAATPALAFVHHFISCFSPLIVHLQQCIGTPAWPVLRHPIMVNITSCTRWVQTCFEFLLMGIELNPSFKKVAFQPP